ncbi:MAG: thioredoxin domain-containing protein, partial [Pseudomonadota bacterium]|nr:thioredoxin domain-containing protein [Pseudomonadota bacterium]
MIINNSSIHLGVFSIRPLEKNPRFSNPLIGSASPYLRQHAHNPVFWYPWGKEALERARAENKPILLSIGYSTCYWCHVMEREVFENLSIASLMNRCFINVKVDREEHPEIDDIYMTARQLMTEEGGWPNNVFLTPDLKPFYAGGTYGATDDYGKPAFPRLLEWLNHAWTTQRGEVTKVADTIMSNMQQVMTLSPPQFSERIDVSAQAAQLFAELKNHHDARGGGFFQAPKFPHESWLQFLLGYYEHTGHAEALEIVTRSLSKMAAGGIYDHVGCGFHRYAVDKDWFIPHFEKMLYTQALLARTYTDAARLANNPWFADIAKSVIDFVAGPFTDGSGAFYAAIDAETDGAEGAYYAWTADELQQLLTREETQFFTAFYVMADIPQFPGHKHAEGQIILARKPFDQAAREQGVPYVQLAAAAGQLMNKLLAVRNQRKAPHLDDKIIVGWNGLMIDALAHAGKTFNHPPYIERAKKAADFLLERCIDNEGSLKRIYAGKRAQIDATLEDYAYLIKGLLGLFRAQPDDNLLDAATSLLSRADELFRDTENGGYFYARPSDEVPLRAKSIEDSALPNANAVMAHNLIDLAELAGQSHYREQAKALAEYFSGNAPIPIHRATLAHALLRLEGKAVHKDATFDAGTYLIKDKASPDNVAAVSAAIFPADAKPGENCEIIVTLDLRDGWHVNASRVNHPFLIPTQFDVQGKGVEIVDILYPEPRRKPGAEPGETLLVYE